MMPTITDWLMVGITLVYVVATAAICYANFKSAKAANAQLKETEQEFYENQRLSIMPFLYLEHISETRNNPSPSLVLEVTLAKDPALFCSHRSFFRLRNVGNGTATNIIYSWIVNEKGISDTECFPENAVAINHELIAAIDYLENGEDTFEWPKKAILEFQYEDLLGQSYVQKMILEFGNNTDDDEDPLYLCSVDTPKYD